MDKLIYDRTQQDVNYALNNPNSTAFLKGSYNYTDLNRIETWCNYLAEQFELYGYDINITTKTNWSMNDIPTKNEMKRIRDNVAELRNAFQTITTLPTTLDKMTHQKANQLEKVLDEIYSIVNGMNDYIVYSNVSSAGQSRVWQNRFRRKYNHVLNILADGRFKNISANYRTNSLARIYNHDNYTTYEMTSDGASGYVYNIYTQATFPLDSTHTYMYVARWRNTEDYPENSLGYYFRNASGGIRNRRFSAHGTEWQTDYDIFSTQNDYTGVYVGINGSNLSQGANFDIEYQALLDITNLDSNYIELIKQRTDKMIAFPKVQNALMMMRAIPESEGDLVE